MQNSSIFNKLKRKNVNTDKIVEEALIKPELIKDLVKGLSSEEAKVKFGSGKVLKLISEKEPEKLYSHFDSIKKFLDHENKILKWTAIIILGNLASVDKKNKVKEIVDTLVSFLHEEKMITANNSIMALGHIAKEKKELRDEITEELLKVEDCKYDTDECLRIALGGVIDAISLYYPEIEGGSEEVLKFVKKQLKSERKSTKKKAEMFLKKY